MTARSKIGPRLPAGLSPAEEARWWDEHRDYWDRAGTREEVAFDAVVRDAQGAQELEADLSPLGAALAELARRS